MTSSFGEITLIPDVEKSILATLKEWSPTYLREMERRTGRKPKGLPNVASWRPTDDILDRFPEQQIPAVQLQCTTDIDLTTRAEDVVAGIRGTIDVIVQSNESEPARELASLYAYSLGLIILQKPQLDGSIKCVGTGWEKMGVPEVGKLKAESRWLAFGSSTIILAVENFASSMMGPEGPQVEDVEPPAYPVVETHHLDLTLEEDPEDE
ncbi:MAG TPA: hypothetical protein VG815_02745 [Chloroflexota bacterium]|nr:hypothetical protein [Chloroflexota bacterium]